MTSSKSRHKGRLAVPRSRESATGRSAPVGAAAKGASNKGAPPTHKYKLKFHPDALQEWRALDNSIRQPLKKALEKRLNNPHVPGGQLHPPLTTCYKIKLNRAGVRLVYEVEDDAQIVYVLAVDKRENSAAYRSAGARSKASTAVATARKSK